MEELKLQARFLLMIYHNPSNGYGVARFISYDKEEKEFTATGIFGSLEEERVYNLSGHYEEHYRYGMQFQVSSYELMRPNDESSLVRYFSSAMFPGIGKKLAQQIVDTLGEDAIDKILEDASCLHTISSLSDKKKAVIIEGVNQFQDLDDSVVFFTKHGLSLQMIAKIQSAYGDEAVSKVKENPYRLVSEVDGIGFHTADKLAGALHFEAEQPYRSKAAILASVMTCCMASGDSFVSMERLYHETKRLMKEEPADINAILDELVMERSIIIEEERIYHHTQYDAECGTAAFLAQYPYMEMEQPSIVLTDEIALIEEKFHITYEDKQKQAIMTFFQEPFAIISGGPGTGKTTIVKGILALAEKLYPQAGITLCAPTGRAAKRMAQLSDREAMTIHSLLKWDLESNQFVKGFDDPLDCDILIVDEFSMVDSWLFYCLLRACKPVAKILLIGDKDQLPSVSPGSVLHDLISSECFPVICLDKIFRQSEGSDVVTLAHEINEGSYQSLQYAKEAAFFNCPAYEICGRVRQIVESAYDKGYENQDIQVLAPMYQGVAGIDALNRSLQELMNPPQQDKREFTIGYRIFREGDKIMQLKNQPEENVYNGDIGSIIEIIYASEDINKQNRIVAAYDDIIVEYTQDMLHHITHAYCISIHKAQGSEYPIVIMPLVNEYRHMLQRRLLYTGVSRAKKSLVLLGQQEALHRGVHSEEQPRKSTLKQRILKAFR
ncbi:MAG: ATP-dependent RecD-like DNA helicase [Erysipelotrichaceae bacterium]|nr:ATP-dependent RecD-like DNA helicase [Erysipelotrichaceae bacterium]